MTLYPWQRQALSVRFFAVGSGSRSIGFRLRLLEHGCLLNRRARLVGQIDELCAVGTRDQRATFRLTLRAQQAASSPARPAAQYVVRKSGARRIFGDEVGMAIRQGESQTLLHG